MEQMPVDLPFELPELHVGFDLGLLRRVRFPPPPDTQSGVATVRLAGDGAPELVVDAGFSWRPIQDHERDEELDGGAGWRLEFDAPRVHPQYLGLRFGLRLVGAVMAHFSAGRKVWVSVVAEPRSWQSLKAAHREAQLPAIARHWERLGFKRDPCAISTYGNTVSRIAHGFRVPAHLATWGPYTESSTAFAADT